jgi:hypothetical protein
MYKQLSLFEINETPYEKDHREMEEKYDRLRKSQHARISGLQKKIDELEEKLNFLIGNICK